MARVFRCSLKRTKSKTRGCWSLAGISSIAPISVAKTPWIYNPIFFNHKRIEVGDFFIQRNLLARMKDPNDRLLAKFEFRYKSDDDLGDQCEKSKFADYIHKGECETFFREILKQVHAKTRLLESDEDEFRFDNRLYKYKYFYNNPIELHITVAKAQSKLATAPDNAFEAFAKNSPGKDSLVDEFLEDLEVLAPSDLRDLFEQMWMAPLLRENLEGGSIAERRTALEFVRRVLIQSVEHINADHKIVSHIDLIANNNMTKQNHADVLVDAVEVVCKLAQKARPKPRRHALARLHFFAKTVEAGHNVKKPAFAESVLTLINDSADDSDVTKAIAILFEMRKNARGSDLVVDKIECKVRMHSEKLHNDSFKSRLKSWLNAA